MLRSAGYKDANLPRGVHHTVRHTRHRAIAARGQQPAPAGGTIDAATRTAAIDGAIDHLRRAYIFADVAEKMAEALRAHGRKKAYDAITSGQAFAETLTRHLQEVSRDKHLRRGHCGPAEIELAVARPPAAWRAASSNGP
jgi:N-terminal domain of Peptidase_S41 in eukaryotic IRBP